MLRILLATTSIVVTTAALAQTQWYVVQDTGTKRCSVVSERPTTKTTVVVSPSGTVYKTREEAETGMRTVKVCKSR